MENYMFKKSPKMGKAEKKIKHGLPKRGSIVSHEGRSCLEFLFVHFICSAICLHSY